MVRPPPRRPSRLATFASLVLLAAAGALLGAAGCSPAGFQPDTGCAALPNCKQCASRGGCGWCANTCVPVEGASCASGLIQDPNTCPGATPTGSSAPAP